jgi:hypothetical protein
MFAATAEATPKGLCASVVSRLPMSNYITGITLPVDGGAWASSGWVRDSQNKWVLVETLSVLG